VRGLMKKLNMVYSHSAELEDYWEKPNFSVPLKLSVFHQNHRLSMKQ